MILHGTIPTRMKEQSLLQKLKLHDLLNVYHSERCKNCLVDTREFPDPEELNKKKKKKALAKLPSSGRQEGQTWKT